MPTLDISQVSPTKLGSYNSYKYVHCPTCIILLGALLECKDSIIGYNQLYLAILQSSENN